MTLILAYKLEDNRLWKRVGVEPSGTPFNSNVQLEYNNGIPRNPKLNSGAIVICDILLSILKDPQTDLLHLLRKLSGNKTLSFSSKIADSEKKVGFNTNYAPKCRI